MLPEKLHVEQINRFHNEVNLLKEQIQNESDIEKKKDMSLKYYKLSELWIKIDVFIEFTVKHELDCINNN